MAAETYLLPNKVGRLTPSFVGDDTASHKATA